MISAFQLERLARVLRQLNPASTFVLDTFFNNTEMFPTKTVRVDIDNRPRRMAPFQNSRSQGTLVEKRGYASVLYQAAYVKPKFTYDPEDLQERYPGETIHQDGTTSLQTLINTDMADLDDMITRREEWMAVQAIVNHSVSIVGEGVNETVDFLFDASHTVTLVGTDLFTDAASRPIQLIETERKKVLQDSGLPADYCLMGADVATAFLDNPNVQKELDLRRMNTGQVNWQELPDGVSYIGDIKGGACGIYTYDEWYVDPVTGLEQPMFPVDKMIIGSSRARSTRNYGAIMDFSASGTGQLRSARTFPKSWLTQDPSVYNLMVQGAPLPAPIQTGAYVTVNAI